MLIMYKRYLLQAADGKFYRKKGQGCDFVEHWMEASLYREVVRPRKRQLKFWAERNERLNICEVNDEGVVKVLTNDRDVLILNIKYRYGAIQSRHNTAAWFSAIDGAYSNSEIRYDYSGRDSSDIQLSDNIKHTFAERLRRCDYAIPGNHPTLDITSVRTCRIVDSHPDAWTWVERPELVERLQRQVSEFMADLSAWAQKE